MAATTGSDIATVVVASITAGLALLAAVFSGIVAKRQASEIAKSERFGEAATRFSDWQNYKRTIYAAVLNSISDYNLDRNDTTRSAVRKHVSIAQLACYPATRATLADAGQNPDKYQGEQLLQLTGPLSDDVSWTPSEAKEKLAKPSAFF
ncbi:hypothetical protein ACFVYT_38345 [Streptomyces sp. NPDC058290]|uniref:hypothetical protein n=1 Tax=Streptomyces sp. NPDC058290 TaxID=3346426 RepID=UPI0036E8DA65